MDRAMRSDRRHVARHMIRLRSIFVHFCPRFLVSNRKEWHLVVLHIF